MYKHEMLLKVMQSDARLLRHVLRPMIKIFLQFPQFAAVLAL